MLGKLEEKLRQEILAEGYQHAIMVEGHDFINLGTVHICKT